VLLSGDVPLLSVETLRALLARHEEAGAAATVLTAIAEDASGYGRIVREGDEVLKIVEDRDASPSERAIREINSGVYAFDLEPLFPALALVVSGGHTHLYEVGERFEYRLLGKTRDDAAGEAYDKVAKLLGFPYPGGPVVDLLAPHGNPNAVKFTLARMKGNPLDFSFSGLKTAVLRWVEQRDMTAEIEARRRFEQPTLEDWLRLTPRATLDLLASFQKTVIEELLRHLAASAEDIGARSLIVSGGVASNAGLRAAARKANLPGPVFFPTPALSTDNAAMIATAAFPKLARREFDDFSLRADANLALA
jgi:N6-L-threonylcarbamoyladenine synthase